MAVIMENYVMLQACSVSMTVRSVDVVQAVLGFSCGELCWCVTGCSVSCEKVCCFAGWLFCVLWYRVFMCCRLFCVLWRSLLMCCRLFCVLWKRVLVFCSLFRVLWYSVFTCCGLFCVLWRSLLLCCRLFRGYVARNQYKKLLSEERQQLEDRQRAALEIQRWLFIFFFFYSCLCCIVLSVLCCIILCMPLPFPLHLWPNRSLCLSLSVSPFLPSLWGNCECRN